MINWTIWKGYIHICQDFSKVISLSTEEFEKNGNKPGEKILESFFLNKLALITRKTT
jgi:hypothetical protein